MTKQVVWTGIPRPRVRSSVIADAVLGALREDLARSNATEKELVRAAKAAVQAVSMVVDVFDDGCPDPDDYPDPPEIKYEEEE